MEHPSIASSNTPPVTARGFTTIELMVVIAIVAILGTLAAPSFTPLIERWRVRQAAEGLQSTLYFARSEAIKRGGNVVIQKLPDGTNGCVASGTADWNCGWIVCDDTNSNGACNTGEPELQRFDAPARVTITRTSNGAAIPLNRWGLVSGTFIGFNVVPADKGISDTSVRGVCISAGGRIRIIPSDQVPCTG